MLKYMTAFIFYTLAMIGVIVIAFVVWKNAVIAAPSKKKSLMKIEESLNLAPRKTLYVIRIAHERFLIASDADKTVFLAKLEEGQGIENPEKYLRADIEKSIPDEIQLTSTAGDIETFSMRKLLNKLATEDVREE